MATADPQLLRDVRIQLTHHELRPVYVVGLITAQVLREVLPDATRRRCFVSGPPAMVDATTSALRSVGVKRTSIRTDFFPGYPAVELPRRRRAFG